MELFPILKYVHILAACLWIGGNAATTLLIARIGREANSSGLPALLSPLGSVGRYISGPAAAIGLLSGGAIVGLYHIGEGALWVTWGLAGMLLSWLLGAFVIGRQIRALAKGSSTNLSRLTALNLLNLAVLLSVVWVMVAKPA